MIWITYLRNIQYTIKILPDFGGYSGKIVYMLNNNIVTFSQ